MSLAEEARELEAARLPGPLCSVQKALRAHPDLADQIVELIADHSISQDAASKVFANRKIDVTAGTISRHRLNNCASCKRIPVKW